MTTINFETKILKESYRTIVMDSKTNNDYNLSRLKYLLLFIKFKVPYDTQYRYEALGYILKEEIEKEKESTYVWQEIAISDRKNLIKHYLKLSSKWEQAVKSFFADYDIELSEKTNWIIGTTTD